uniref:Aspartic proteinase nepenthesin-1 n=1 Tax=Aegilops tauschii TaxID=37682 RepID=R7WDH4_AEGTA
MWYLSWEQEAPGSQPDSAWLSCEEHKHEYTKPKPNHQENTDPTYRINKHAKVTISATSFSYCLVDRDSPSSSTLQFGDAEQPAVTAPLLRSPRTNTFYYVGLSGISVGGQALSIPSSAFAMDDAGSGGVIVDSGTAVTRLQSGAYAALREASVQVRAVARRFEGGGELKLPAKNYLIPVDGAGTYCLAFAGTSGAVSIIGNVQQQGVRVSFDTAKNTVGFTTDKC